MIIFIHMKKDYEDDDGRTIADMSNVEGRTVSSAFRSRRKSDDPEAAGRITEVPEEDKKARKHYVLGAMSAGLLIGTIYLVAFAIVIVIMLLIMLH